MLDHFSLNLWWICRICTLFSSTSITWNLSHLLRCRLTFARLSTTDRTFRPRTPNLIWMVFQALVLRRSQAIINSQWYLDICYYSVAWSDWIADVVASPDEGSCLVLSISWNYCPISVWIRFMLAHTCAQIPIGDSHFSFNAVSDSRNKKKVYLFLGSTSNLDSNKKLVFP